jgi:hypothetical protein
MLSSLLVKPGPFDDLNIEFISSWNVNLTTIGDLIGRSMFPQGLCLIQDRREIKSDCEGKYLNQFDQKLSIVYNHFSSAKKQPIFPGVSEILL